ncbi:pentapeptide repeat-containing protein [Myroides fluvii]|uniref:pentapeptide repeat-containing protein n=1 Tax=Myroides fluvii TaxID=2572594 RepID=UPI00131DB9AE|nr:pentapeptide repeat-containing protein [Myroides fluvii]
MSKSKLIERWELDVNLYYAFNQINQLLTKGGKLTLKSVPLDLIDGKLDVRGLKLNGNIIKKLDVQHADFSFSSFDKCWIEKSSFNNCYFEKVDFSHFSDHKNVFHSCVFKDCKFNYTALGYDGTKFSTCIFENCTFTKAIFSRPEFVDIIFKNCRLKAIDFNASSFENCFFEGELNDVWFRGDFPLQSDYMIFGKPKKNEMKNVSFEKAYFRDLTFSDNCDLSTVKIKNFDKYYRFNRWKERLLFLESNIHNWSEKEKYEAGVFVSIYMVHAQNQDWYIFNIEDVERDYGKEVAFKIINKLSEF